ncbi:outer membrane pore protein [Escherichia coli O145:H28]|uniref:CP4-44 prophage predicted disrupted hemin or colicin receptor n=2 Tax=Escherichia coli TaxID=562 RepID=A0AB38F099_ECOLX|nr:outer membrane pore protein [Escherichia coli O157:H7 str. Sakai] [Escherichia coli]NP_304296.1 outer membrane pore protein [Escherichia coli O157:H7 str. Sakai]AIF93053.1 putative membrane protein [Escherichia coli O157:H7 str. SS17]BBC49727.1 outer membrane pore protein [Escherichia coli O157:H7]BCZ66317.1 hypothetical protein EC12E115_1303 [Escherichia coli O145:H28]CTT14149.1 CP4-44 prophage%3B predicted disrupted hemin or colicin receptor [Escherichia coli]CTT23094.1 CP4-44 prophage%3
MTGGIAQKVNDPHGSPSESCCFIRPLKPSVSVSIAEDQLLLLIYSVFTCPDEILFNHNIDYIENIFFAIIKNIYMWNRSILDGSLSTLVYLIFFLLVSLCHADKILCFSLFGCCLYYDKSIWICPYISRHLLSLNPLQARCRRYSRGER